VALPLGFPKKFPDVSHMHNVCHPAWHIGKREHEGRRTYPGSLEDAETNGEKARFECGEHYGSAGKREAGTTIAVPEALC